MCCNVLPAVTNPLLLRVFKLMRRIGQRLNYYKSKIHRNASKKDWFISCTESVQ